MRPPKFIVEIAKACASTPKRDSRNRFKVGAAIYDKKKLISFGANDSGRCLRSYNRKCVRTPGEVHAEVMAIIGARQDLRGCAIVVVRVNKKGDLRIARPCSFCLSYLESVGLREIYYSTSEGRIEKLIG